MNYLRIHPANRYLGNPKIAIVAALTVFNILGVLVFFHYRSKAAIDSPGSLAAFFFQLVLWAPPFLLSSLELVRRRSDGFWLSLPISARKTWLSQNMIILASGISFWAPTLILMRILIWALSQEHGPLLDSSFLWHTFLTQLFVFMCCSFLLQFPSRKKSELPMSNLYLAFAFLIGLLGLKAVIIIISLPYSWLLLLLIINAVLGLVLYQTVPNCLSLESSTAGDSGNTAEWAELSIKGMSKFRQNFIIIQGLAKRPSLFLTGLIFIFFFGMMCSNLDNWGPFHHEQQLFYSVFTVYLLLAFFASSLYGLLRMEPLPIPRSRIFRLMTIPLALALFSGITCSEYIYQSPERSPMTLTCKPNKEGSLRIIIPYKMGSWVWEKSAPDITSPWGETEKPWSSTVIKGIPLKWYSPYSISDDSSPKLIALQLTRAVNALGGPQVKWQDTLSTKLTTTPDGKTNLSPEGLKWLNDVSKNIPKDPIHYLPPIVGATITLWMLCIVWLSRYLNSSYSEKSQKIRFWGLLGSFLAFHIIGLFSGIMGFTDLDGLRAMYAYAIQSMSQTVTGVILVWLVPIAVSFFAFRLAEKAFRKVELSHTFSCRS